MEDQHELEEGSGPIGYTYDPLPEDSHTRVLELCPALNADAPLRGNFRHVHLDVDPFYDAVSYTWGEPNFTEEIFIGEGGLPLRITANLHDALVRYRHPTETRSLWADAICINQRSEGEKSKQIPLMRDIYRCASSVLVWLGVHPSGEACLREIALISQRRTVATTGASDTEEVLSLLNRLVSLSWFSRRWVIQELVSNPSVVFFCRTASVPWLRIAQLLKFVPEGASSPQISRLVLLRKMWDVHSGSRLHGLIESQTQKTGILNLLSGFSDAGCADARDRIYALVGLASDVVFGEYETRRQEKKILIRIDYNRSVEQVYDDFALAVEDSGSVDKLVSLRTEVARRLNPPLGGLMSWVPDWRLPDLHPQLYECVDIWPFEYDYQIEEILSGHYPTDGGPEAKSAWVRDALTKVRDQRDTSRFGEDRLWEILYGLFGIEFNRDIFHEGDAYEETMLKGLESAGLDDRLSSVHLFTASLSTSEPHSKYTPLLLGVGRHQTRVGDIICCPQWAHYFSGDISDVLIVRETAKSRKARSPEGVARFFKYTKWTCQLVGLGSLWLSSTNRLSGRRNISGIRIYIE